MNVIIHIHPNCFILLNHFRCRAIIHWRSNHDYELRNGHDHYVSQQDDDLNEVVVENENNSSIFDCSSILECQLLENDPMVIEHKDSQTLVADGHSYYRNGGSKTTEYWLCRQHYTALKYDCLRYINTKP